jgi:hypothetical protein
MLAHLHDRFPGCEVAVLPPAPGPIHDLVPSLHILSLTPTEGGQLYATAGLWEATHHGGHGLELVLHAPAADDEVHVETLTMVAYYHATGGDYELDHGHTVPIGRPWVHGSKCDHLLVSLPYPWGPDLETCTYLAVTYGCCGYCPSPQPKRRSGTPTTWKPSSNGSKPPASFPPTPAASPSSSDSRAYASRRLTSYAPIR